MNGNCQLKLYSRSHTRLRERALVRITSHPEKAKPKTSRLSMRMPKQNSPNDKKSLTSRKALFLPSANSQSLVFIGIH